MPFASHRIWEVISTGNVCLTVIPTLIVSIVMLKVLTLSPGRSFIHLANGPHALQHMCGGTSSSEFGPCEALSPEICLESLQLRSLLTWDTVVAETMQWPVRMHCIFSHSRSLAARVPCAAGQRHPSQGWPWQTAAHTVQKPRLCKRHIPSAHRASEETWHVHICRMNVTSSQARAGPVCTKSFCAYTEGDLPRATACPAPNH